MPRHSRASGVLNYVSMIVRFCAYSVLKNLRFADPFFLLFLRDAGLSYTAIGALLGFQNLIVAFLEVPLGVWADRFGRRRSLAACFLAYGIAFTLYPGALYRTAAFQSGLLYLAATVFALAEALRSGSHKAIMLDYLDGRHESDRATYVIGLTRSFSKFSAGLSAVTAGVLLYLTNSWVLLFLLSAAAAVAGFFVMLSYPRRLEGEQQRSGSPKRTWRAHLEQLAAGPGWMGLIMQSILFESQVRLVTKYYVQVFLNDGLRAFGYAVMPSSHAVRTSTGAVWYGLHEAIREALGGAAARLGPVLEKSAGGSQRALRVAQGTAALALVALAFAAFRQGAWLALGVMTLLFLTVLSNARKPVFVGAFNRVMDKPRRATALSIHSFANSMVFAALLPLTGWLTDQYGLVMVFSGSAALASIGLFLGPVRSIRSEG